MTPEPTTPPRYAWSIAGIAIVLALAVAPVTAQETTNDPATIPGIVELQLGLTRLAGVTSGQAGVVALVDLPHGVRLGGGAWSLLRRISDGPVLSGSGLELSLGYGGGIAEIDIPRTYLAARLLVGGGAATLRTLAVGARFDTETFVVVEPGLVAWFPLGRVGAVGGVASFRAVRGADALFLADDDDLRGFQASVFVRLGGR